MDAIVNYICENAHLAPYIIFALLMLAGLNVPISEDILLLTGGMLATTCAHSEAFYLYTWIYFGCIFSAWEAYWIGRRLGPHLYEVKWFKRILTRERTDYLNHTYEKYGIWTFFVGRFIPGGVRNALFVTAGLGKMPFLNFIIRDSLACLVSSSTLFVIGYYFGTNFQALIDNFKTYSLIAIAVMLIGLIVTIPVIYYKRKREKALQYTS